MASGHPVDDGRAVVFDPSDPVGESVISAAFDWIGEDVRPGLGVETGLSLADVPPVAEDPLKIVSKVVVEPAASVVVTITGTTALLVGLEPVISGTVDWFEREDVTSRSVLKPPSPLPELPLAASDSTAVASTVIVAPAASVVVTTGTVVASLA